MEREPGQRTILPRRSGVTAPLATTEFAMVSLPEKFRNGVWPHNAAPIHSTPLMQRHCIQRHCTHSAGVALAHPHRRLKANPRTGFWIGLRRPRLGRRKVMCPWHTSLPGPSNGALPVLDWPLVFPQKAIPAFSLDRIRSSSRSATAHSSS